MNTFKVNDEDIHLYYQPNILSKSELDELRLWLDNKDYKIGTLLNGKEISRHQLWFQEKGKYFCKSWKFVYDRWKSQEYDSYLINFQSKINSIVDKLCQQYNLGNININSCLINKYRDGNDSIKPHVDNRESFGEYPIIVGFSVGGERELVFKKILDINTNSLKIDNNYEQIKYKLENNSLFIMAGASQKYFTHEVPKCDSKETRYSLTFREFNE